MAIRIKHKVRPQIAEDTAMKNLLYGPDDTLSEVTIDSYVRQTSGKISIAQNTNEDVPLGDITAVKGFFLQVNGDCQIKINGSADAIQVRKATDANVDWAKFFIEADISQVNITAPADSAISGTFCAWGDTS